MTYPDIRAALGRERLNTLLADAEAARDVRQARLYRRQAATPARRGSPLRRFTRLSAESRRLRFLPPEDKLSPAELRSFTTAGHHDQEELGALNDRTGRGVGAARYVRHADDPQTAEIAALYSGSAHR